MKLKLLITLVLLASVATAQQRPNKNIQFLAQKTFGSPGSGNDMSNIGGYVDTTGKEYALVGWEQGLRIYDVSTPTNPVNVKDISGLQSYWREVKTRGKYAYITTEAGNGLQIANLSSLPNAAGIVTKQWQPSYMGQTLNTIHALHIDGRYLYLYGSNIGNSGALICDLIDPWNPVIVGAYDDTYVHDGFVLNDTLYACHIYDGYFTIVDCSNKANPAVIGGPQNTPNNFSHNSWLSNDHKYLFTTDEVDDTYLTAYDIQDLNNITELDRIQSQNPGSQSIVHNTHIVQGDWAVTSWYKDGVVITDVSRPQNLVNVGWYDTSPLMGGDFDGAWGVYPFLPSGNLVVSDISYGLFVLKPTYKRACFLEGTITDAACGGPLNGVTITAYGPDTISALSNFSGEIKTGSPDTGTYTVYVTKTGYTTQIVTVHLSSGTVSPLNISLSAGSSVNVNGNVTSNSVALPGANVNLNGNGNNFNYVTDASGNFSQCGITAGTYTVTEGKWGYTTQCNNQTINAGNGNLNFVLNPGYYDDFSFNFGWNVNTTSSSGAWERAVPMGNQFQNGSYANPNTDASDDCGDMAFVSGNNGVNAGDDDIDNGYSELTSPTFNLSSHVEPYINYERWFANGGGTSAGNDSLLVTISNGTQSKVIERVSRNTAGMGTWVQKSFKVSDYVTPTSTMTVKFFIEDYSPGHVTEGGVDKFEITDGWPTFVNTAETKTALKAYPNPFNNTLTIDYSFVKENSVIKVLDVTGKIVEQQTATKSEGNFITGQSLSAGIYFIQVIAESGETAAIKVVKN